MSAPLSKPAGRPKEFRSINDDTPRHDTVGVSWMRSGMGDPVGLDADWPCQIPFQFEARARQLREPTRRADKRRIPVCEEDRRQCFWQVGGVEVGRGVEQNGESRSEKEHRRVPASTRGRRGPRAKEDQAEMTVHR
jgi:hypothetical protein